MIAFKSCPRCRGDVLIESDDELVCLQCGQHLRPREAVIVLAMLRQKALRPATAKAASR